MNQEIHAGAVFSAERTFTAEDVRQFALITGDHGRHHVTPDEKGRLLVHGLLVASVGTEIGGRLDYLARDMNFEFVRPVFVGDTVRVELTITAVRPEEQRLRVSMALLYRNQHGKEVIEAKSHGVILG